MKEGFPNNLEGGISEAKRQEAHTRISMEEKMFNRIHNSPKKRMLEKATMAAALKLGL